VRQLIQQHLACVVAHGKVAPTSRTTGITGTTVRAAEGHALDALEGRLLRGPVGEHRVAWQVDQLQLVLLLQKGKPKKNLMSKQVCRNACVADLVGDMHMQNSAHM
jgi:hypothetical protein